MGWGESEATVDTNDYGGMRIIGRRVKVYRVVQKAFLMPISHDTG